MATGSDTESRASSFSRKLVIVGPLAAQTAVWLTTSGHTANFREMNDARGWIPAVGFGLHSAYLFAVAMAILMAPTLRRSATPYVLTQIGLVLLISGSLMNGLGLH
ncbi:MAG: hypothetical protein LC104_04670, partial [Bacteroidales bacterium]|nr:hypothetical protein [Bacteroidales bacterium]